MRTRLSENTGSDSGKERKAIQQLSPPLSPASIRKIARIAAMMTEHEMIGTLVEEGLLQGEQDFYNKSEDYMTSLSRSKAAKSEAILKYFNKDSTVLAAGGVLIQQAIQRFHPGPDIENLNRSLVRDGLQYDPMSGRIVPATGAPEEEKKLQTELDRRLWNLNPEFQRMHEGLWDAISSGSADKLRQANSSARELLRQTVDHLVGNGLEKMSRKARIKRILQSESRGELVDAIAELVDQLYGAQSAQEHSRPDPDTVILTAKITEYCLLYVLRKIPGP